MITVVWGMRLRGARMAEGHDYGSNGDLGLCTNTTYDSSRLLLHFALGIARIMLRCDHVAVSTFARLVLVR
jgi:hypothetical protein